MLNTKSAWPRDQADYVFLGNAIERLGREYFGASWTGAERFVPILFNLPPLTGMNKDGRARVDAHNLLSGVPGYIACPLVTKLPLSLAALGTDRAKPAGEIRDYDFSEKQWELASNLRVGQIEDLAPALQRLRKMRGFDDHLHGRNDADGYWELTAPGRFILGRHLATRQAKRVALG